MRLRYAKRKESVTVPVVGSIPDKSKFDEVSSSMLEAVCPKLLRRAHLLPECPKFVSSVKKLLAGVFTSSHVGKLANDV